MQINLTINNEEPKFEYLKTITNSLKKAINGKVLNNYDKQVLKGIEIFFQDLYKR